MMPAAASALMSAAWTESPMSVNGPSAFGVRPCARTKMEAIRARVRFVFGQNLSLLGGLQPLVMPMAAMASM